MKRVYRVIIKFREVCWVVLAVKQVQLNERKRTIRKKRIPAIRSRVFPEYVCIEDVDKIISSVHESCSRKTSHSFWKHIYSYRELKISGMNGKGQGLLSTGGLNLRPTTCEEDQRSLPQPARFLRAQHLEHDPNSRSFIEAGSQKYALSCSFEIKKSFLFRSVWLILLTTWAVGKQTSWSSAFYVQITPTFRRNFTI